MPVYHSAFFAALVALLHFYLAMRIIGHRRAKRISLGDGGSDSLSYLIRAQANLLEYAIPMGFMLLTAELLLILDNRMGGVWGWIWIALALTFLVGRGLHTYGMLTSRIGKARVVGMHCTLWPFLGTIILTLALSVGI